MKTIRLLVCIFAVLLLTAAAPASGQQKQQQQPILVGHIDHLEGQLLRYVPENKDWVATVKDAPFGLEDALYADKNTRAEIIMPNNTMLRIGGSTQAQLLRLAEDVTEIDIASGTARFYNNSSNAIISATTPFGSVVAPAGTSFDLYVGDESVEVIALKGRIEFVHPSGTTKYEVIAGASSIVANRSQVSSGEGMTDASWNGWNTERDRIWEQRLAPRGETTRHLPPQLQTEAYVLEEQGSWENVEYEGGQRQFWRPTHVSAGWAPYTNGRWTTWYGDQVWIPSEPFGYVTHHYGSWVYVDAGRCWYWAPPVVAVGVHAVPSYTISYGWYPGRVSWIYTETYVGWVPLAPYEPYYCHNYWGPSAIVSINIYDDHHGRHDKHHGKHHYEDHAVVIHQNDFYRGNNYHDVRIRNVDRATIAKSYRGSPVVNDLVLKNHKNALQKYNFADINVHQKPHQTVRERIQQNFATAKRGDRQNASAIAQKLDRMQPGKPADGRFMERQPLKVTDKLVPDRDVNKPKALTPFATRDLKPSGQVRPAQQETKEPLRDKPSFDADRDRPEHKGFDGGKKPDQGSEKFRFPEAGKDRPEPGENKSGMRPERYQKPDGQNDAKPERPVFPVFNKPEETKKQPLRDDERTTPGKPDRFQKPDVQDNTRPVRPERPVFNKPDESKAQPLRDDERTTPGKPERFQKPDVQDNTRPVRPERPVFNKPDESKAQPLRDDERTTPAKPDRFQKPDVQDNTRPVRPERPVFNKPDESKTQPLRDDERTTPAKPERYQRPEPARPQMDRNEQPRQVETPVRREQPVQQPRTIEQPRQATPEPRQQPRQIETPVRREQPVQQPRTIQQQPSRQTTPEPRQQPRQVEPPVRHEQPVQQPRAIQQQPRQATPEPRQQPRQIETPVRREQPVQQPRTTQQPNRTPSQTPNTIPPGSHR